MKTIEEARHVRRPEYPVNDIFLNRWSSRALSGEEISEEELMGLFEAAKWAPSSYNNQSWRFIYARRGTPDWDAFLDLLVDNNRQWAKNGAALVVIVSKTTYDFNGKPARTHSFDAGAAWENFALQGSLWGLVVHGMEGFDYEKTRKTLGIPADHVVEAMAVVGRPGDKEALPGPMREKESPTGRKPLSEIAFEGKFAGGGSMS